MSFDPERDLRIDRPMRASPEAIWRCWTDEALFEQWFTPPPVKVVSRDYDFQPGGRCHVVMKLPDGTLMPSDGCFLLVEPCRRLIFGDALTAGFRPGAQPFMTADIRLTPTEGGTHYAVHVMHVDAEGRKAHEKMGFHDGWGTTMALLDELAAAL